MRKSEEYEVFEAFRVAGGGAANSESKSQAASSEARENTITRSSRCCVVVAVNATVEGVRSVHGQLKWPLLVVMRRSGGLE
jgi:hypothetical protein